MNQTAITKLIRFLAIAVATLTSLRADNGPTGDLSDQADAVVVAEVQSGQQTAHTVVFALSVSRTLKGDLTPGSTVNISGGAGLSTNRTLGGQYGLWFLKKAGGQWTFLPVVQGNGLLESSGYIPLPRTSSPASVSTVSQPVTISDHMATELVAALQGYSDPRQIYPIALALSGIRGSAILSGLYGTLRESPDPQLRFIGLTGAWNVSADTSALAEIASNVDLIPKLRTRSLVLNVICGTSKSDPGVVQSLGRIAASSDETVQRCAADALDFIHTRETLPFLAQLLESKDPKTREYAMQGLSRFVDNLPIQTVYNTLNGKALAPQGPTPYRTPETDKYSLSRRQLGTANEADYLQFWRSWWASMEDKLTAKTP